ncbi:conserved hypothetical protein [Candidatus Desulfarcum epimagneticum]|uniref:Rubrerythrin diiron-binding domain-containing protein n=1 Tax=uncultured Desulfobacteraceae bacterium TaxID=218296 RepID=A0A484HD17_9BACT|nr:conserved hypothetical protein [uncultured Desulfobacteraceae bacterium]
MISRRQLLRLSVLFSFCYPFANIRHFAEAEEREDGYPRTRALLERAYWSETTAHRHYDEYRKKALSEGYPNIAYLFHAFSVSEKIHSENFKKILLSFGDAFQERPVPVSSADTKSNLNAAAVKELQKINRFYPDIIKKMSFESHDQTVLNCMYSWKSHQQHEKIIRDIKKFSGLFFKPLAKKIEKMSPHYHVCDICGSTMDEKPELPCEICDYPVSHYKKIQRPV